MYIPSGTGLYIYKVPEKRLTYVGLRASFPHPWSQKWGRCYLMEHLVEKQKSVAFLKKKL